MRVGWCSASQACSVAHQISPISWKRKKECYCFLRGLQIIIFRLCIRVCKGVIISRIKICSKTLQVKFLKCRLFQHISHTKHCNFWFVVCTCHCTGVNISRAQICSKTLQLIFLKCRLWLQLKQFNITSYLFKSNFAMLFLPGFTAIFSGSSLIPSCSSYFFTYSAFCSGVSTPAGHPALSCLSFNQVFT